MLDGCPITEEEIYREEVFKLIPHLKCIDGKDSQGNYINDKEDNAESEESEESDQENSKLSDQQEDPSVKIINENNEADKEEAKYYNYAGHNLNSSYKNSFLSRSNSYPVQALEEGFPSLPELDYQFEVEDTEEHNVAKRNRFIREDSFVEFPVEDHQSDSDNGTLYDHI